MMCNRFLTRKRWRWRPDSCSPPSAQHSSPRRHNRPRMPRGGRRPRRQRSPPSRRRRKAAREFKMVLEPKAMDLLKAISARLAKAKAMSFTATVRYEYPSRLGPPIVYTTRYDVTMQRPDKLTILIPGDGPASEFDYDGKAMIAYAPAEDLVAVAEAPPTIEEALKAGTKRPRFTFRSAISSRRSLCRADRRRHPRVLHRALGRGRRCQDRHGGLGEQGVFVQIWIGADDKLPRRVGPSTPRTRCSAPRAGALELAARPVVAPDTFMSDKARAANRIPFRSRDPANIRNETDGQDHARRCLRTRDRMTPRRHAIKTTSITVLLLISPSRVDRLGEAGASANPAGGSTSHSYGSTSHENRYGGSSSHEAGEGTEHTNAYGGGRRTPKAGGPSTPTHTAAHGRRLRCRRGAYTPMARPCTIRPAVPAAYPLPVPSADRGAIIRPAATDARLRPVRSSGWPPAQRSRPPTRRRQRRTPMRRESPPAARTPPRRPSAYSAGVATAVRPMRWGSITPRCPPARWRSTRTAPRTTSMATPGSSRRTARTACISTWCPRPEDPPSWPAARRLARPRRIYVLRIAAGIDCMVRVCGRNSDVTPTTIDRAARLGRHPTSSSANGEKP